MAASTADLTNNVDLIVDTIPLPIAASTIIYDNQAVCLDASGNLNPAANTAGLVPVGISVGHFDNSAGIAGAVKANVSPFGARQGNRFRAFDCSGASQAWVGTVVFYTDDHTVAATGSNSITAGMVVQFLSATKVIVDTTRRSTT